MLRSRFAGVLVASAAIFLSVTGSAWAAAPAIESESSGSVNATAATLAAQINPNGEEATYQFEYSKQATGETLEGTITKVSGAGPLSETQGVEGRIESLEPQTQYFWRVVATNAASETTTGKVESFTTPLHPETPTLEAERVGMTAHLKGVLNPNKAGEAGSYEFIYRLSPTECEGESATPGETALGAKEEAVATEVGLQPSETYSFCLRASNGAGETAVSAPQTLTTPAAPPAIEEESSGGVTSTAATLSALINANNQETNYKFEYSTQATGETLEGTITELPGSSPLSATFGNQTAEVKAESLQPRTEYFYRVVATNASAETTTGVVKSFTTVDAPLVTTGAALGISRTKASVSGTVNPGGVSTSYHFVYVEAAHYNPGALECPQELACAYSEGKTTTSEVLGATDYTAHPAGPQALEELKPGTTYHYALVASNSTGTRVGADQTFTTSPATPPSASTGEATGVSQLQATLTGTADIRGLPGTMSFQVALTPEGGSLEPATVTGSLSGTSVTITFSFGPYLQPGTTYYYRAVATNADGSEAGEWRSFTTTTFPSPFAEGPPSIPLLHIPSEFEEKKPPRLTNAQKLAKALRACHKDKKKSKRVRCERQAHRRYGPKHR